MGSRLRQASLCLALFVTASPALLGQATSCPPHTNLDELIKALDAGVSGPPDKDRSCLADLLLPDATLSPIHRTPSGSFEPLRLSLAEWTAQVKQHATAPFYERQVKYSAQVFGNLAHLWSTYEVRPTPDGALEVRGINSIQAVFDGKQWHIADILWQAENATTKVPKEYLP